MGEYKASQKISLKYYAWLAIEPVIAFGFIVFKQAELPSDTLQGLARQTHFLGDFALIHRSYMIIMSITLIIWSVKIIRQKTQKKLRPLMQFAACIITPMLLFLAYRDGYIPKPVGAPALVLILIWAAKQSNLLDIIPSALSGVLDKVNAGMMVFNSQNKTVYQNQFAKHLFTHYSNKSAPLDLLHRTFDFASKHPQSAQLTLNNDAGDDIYIDASLEPIINAKTKQNLGYVALLQDISVRKKSEITLAESNQRLINLDRQKTSFFTGISHEFRTPLTLIIGELNDLLSGEFGSISRTHHQVLSSIKNNNQQLLNLVSQLLELAQLNDNKMPFNPQSINLSNYIPSVIANFESIALKQDVTLCFQNNTTNSALCFDIDALNKVLVNLISNALKSIKNGGNISIQLDDSNDGSALELHIKDTGYGIDAAVLPYIFDAFYFHENAHPHWPIGTGIGLHYTKQLLENYGSTIFAASELNKGSQFTVVFNKVQDTDSLESALLPEQAEAQVKHDLLSNSIAKDQHIITTPESGELAEAERLILIVEDNIGMRRYLRRHLSKEFRLIEAEDGEEGFELAKHSIPDIILTDIMMPKLDGLQFSQLIRNHFATSHIPIIVLTAKSMPADKKRGFELGVDDFLTKPFDTHELSTRIHNLIKSRARLKQHYQQYLNLDTPTLPHAFLPKKEAPFIEKLHVFVTNNVANKKLLIRDIASHVHMSERSLHRKLHAITGLSPKQWLLNTKVDLATQKLRNSTDSITQIALETGFSDPSHFSKAFKNKHSISPTEYKNHKLS